MKLSGGKHLAYCGNIHRGESWDETFSNLKRHTLAVRDRVGARGSFGIGLRLSAAAARELRQPERLREFRDWLERENCYVFTINGFPYGQFHGARVKEKVYAPDWTDPARLEYTLGLFEILAELLPPDIEGSVSTVPGSFKEFVRQPEQEAAMRQNLRHCVRRMEAIRERTDKRLHLGLEPEPLCYLETSQETVDFFERFAAEAEDCSWRELLGVNYDACHLAVEFEEPRAALGRLLQAGIKISKLHFSSALEVEPTLEARRRLKDFIDPVYFHQVIERGPGGQLRRWRDLDEALAQAPADESGGRRWRIHFHIPLHCRPGGVFETTAGHLLEVMDLLKEGLPCSHFEMETYTWEALPAPFKHQNVVDQLAAEYEWTLGQLAERGFAWEAC